jgi:hypothetical protein
MPNLCSSLLVVDKSPIPAAVVAGLPVLVATFKMSRDEKPRLSMKKLQDEYAQSEDFRRLHDGLRADFPQEDLAKLYRRVLVGEWSRRNKVDEW